MSATGEACFKHLQKLFWVSAEIFSLGIKLFLLLMEVTVCQYSMQRKFCNHRSFKFDKKLNFHQSTALSMRPEASALRPYFWHDNVRKMHNFSDIIGSISLNNDVLVTDININL